MLSKDFVKLSLDVISTITVKITNTNSLHLKNSDEDNVNKNSDNDEEKDTVSKRSKSKKVPKRGIEIDEFHTLIVAKYGLVIKYEKEGNISFKKVKKNVDIIKLKNKEIGLEDILESENNKNKSKNLGFIGEHQVVLKNGKFGCYAVYKNKNISLSKNEITLNIPFDKITLQMIKQILNEKKKNFLLKII